MNAIVLAAERAAEEHGWSATQQSEALREYERFVELAEANPGVPLVPAADVDLIWHEHLELSDEQGVPAPAHSAHETEEQSARFALTRRLYAERFGPPGRLWTTPADCQVDEPPDAP